MIGIEVGWLGAASRWHFQGGLVFCGKGELGGREQAPRGGALTEWGGHKPVSAGTREIGTRSLFSVELRHFVFRGANAHQESEGRRPSTPFALRTTPFALRTTPFALRKTKVELDCIPPESPGRRLIEEIELSFARNGLMANVGGQ
jgi:hypothetical protein